MSNSSSQHPARPQHPLRLLERVREALRRKHYSYRTEQAYIYWVKRYILFHNRRHPKDMGAPEIEAFLRAALETGAGGRGRGSLEGEAPSWPAAAADGGAKARTG